MATTIDLLRHGALLGGIRYRGSTQAALSDSGRAAMDAVWAQLCGDVVSAIVSSPLSRCSEPATAWAQAANIPCNIVDDLREMHYGAWEGLTATDIERQFPNMLQRWRENPLGMHIPGAETVESFAARVIKAWQGILAAAEGKHILLVAHSGTLRVILAHVLAAPLVTTRRVAMPYASWSRVAMDNGQCRLVYLNWNVDKNLI
ncbi:MAG: histidine phosphatase family protein [Mariprofundaceae bacterium]|nr:histidine phosphatase family protein [Mariprofundaceae bacterium]